MTEYWQCTFCVFVNESDSETCWACRQKKRRPTIKEWSCTRCTLLNEQHSRHCSACGYENLGSNFVSNSYEDEEQLPCTENSRLHRLTNTDSPGTPEYIRPSINTNRHLSIIQNDDLLENAEIFECSLCYLECYEGDGVVLENCFHSFCKKCLTEVIQYSSEAEIKCPFKGRGYVCPSPLADREVHALLLSNPSNANGSCIADVSILERSTGFNFTTLNENLIAARYEFDENSLELSHQLNDVRLNENQNDATFIRDTFRIHENRPHFLAHSLLLPAQQTKQEQRALDYQKLLDLDRKVLIPNAESFDCSICFVEQGQGEGVVMRDCLHTFCKECLKQAIQLNTEAEMRCPFGDENNHCDSLLQDREIRALVGPEMYEKHLTRSVTEAENRITNAFHCKTVDCTGWCIYEEDVTEFYCPVCKKTNCINCKAIHTGLNCKQYQEKIKREIECNTENSKTKNMLEEMVKKGEAMACPTCQIILSKIAGCDWLRCSMCKTEICWITRGPRWGPKGAGDVSGGCRCRLNGQWCHPQCGNCH